MTSMLTDVQIIALFTKAVFEIERKELTDISPNTDISTLGFDSVTTMEILSHIEEELAFEFPEDELGNIYLMSDLIRLVQSLL